MRFRCSHLFRFDCKLPRLILAWAFSLGLLAGTLLCAGTGKLLGQTREALAYPVGLSTLIPAALPLLFSGAAVYIRRPLLLIPVAFWKAFFFSCTASGLVSVWGSAGWLVGGLAMFGSLGSMPVLWWYWLRHICGEGFQTRTFLAALGSSILIGLFDFWVISPFLESILIL